MAKNLVDEKQRHENIVNPTIKGAHNSGKCSNRLDLQASFSSPFLFLRFLQWPKNQFAFSLLEPQVLRDLWLSSSWFHCLVARKAKICFVLFFFFFLFCFLFLCVGCFFERRNWGLL